MDDEVRKEEEDDVEKKEDQKDNRTSALLTRRHFAEGAVGAVVLVALGGAGMAFGDSGDILRPPGGQDKKLLLGACIRCDRCREICPLHAIDVATIEDSLEDIRTPKLNFHRGYCNSCDGDFLCRSECPTGALTTFDIKNDRIGLAVIDFDRCEVYGTSARCKTECIPACPEDALYLNESGRLLINDDACWGCGACEYVCPTNSYRVYDGITDRGINVHSVA